MIRGFFLATFLLAAFRARLTTEAYTEAREAAVSRLVRERFGLPLVAFD